MLTQSLLFWWLDPRRWARFVQPNLGAQFYSAPKSPVDRSHYNSIHLLSLSTPLPCLQPPVAQYPVDRHISVVAFPILAQRLVYWSTPDFQSWLCGRYFSLTVSPFDCASIGSSELPQQQLLVLYLPQYSQCREVHRICCQQQVFPCSIWSWYLVDCCSLRDPSQIPLPGWTTWIDLYLQFVYRYIGNASNALRAASAVLNWAWHAYSARCAPAGTSIRHCGINALESFYKDVKLIIACRK